MAKRPAQRTTRTAKPKDSDGDGLSDAEERRLGTNPRSRDTDHDGMPDDMEVTWKPPTDPRRKDTDGDGLSDWAELMIGSDPTNADTDGDGWRDGYEVGRGTDPIKATSAPPEGDGLTGSELKAMQDVFQTSPGERDADHDGLNDEFERRLGTNPNLADTDNDGLGDMVEWLRGSNPKSPGRIDPQSNYDLNRVETGKPLPASERKDDPRWGPLGPKRSGKRADAGDGAAGDADADGGVATVVGNDDGDALLGTAAPVAEPGTATDTAGTSTEDAVASSGAPAFESTDDVAPSQFQTPTDAAALAEVAIPDDSQEAPAFATDDAVIAQDDPSFAEDDALS